MLEKRWVKSELGFSRALTKVSQSSSARARKVHKLNLKSEGIVRNYKETARQITGFAKGDNIFENGEQLIGHGESYIYFMNHVWNQSILQFSWQCANTSK